jgi:hypothetical protein
MLSSYSVQDKQQVADLDLSMIVEEDYVFEDDGSYDACMVCDEFGDSSQLMYCHSCEQLCHVFCAGLDRMPTRGAWYCQGCMEDPASLDAATRRPAARGPAAFINGRNRIPRRNRGPDEWVGVWQSVWNRLHFDIEFPFGDDDQSETRSEVERRENQEWERRFELARQMGAGTRFRAAADTIHARRNSHGSRSRPINRSLHREAPRTPKDPESQEELRAWNAFEKAREQVAEAAGDSRPTERSHGRRRKRASVDSSPAEPEPQEPQPERKLKRPRTRLNVEVPESSANGARRNTVVQNTSPPNGNHNGDSSTAPGFLQAILQEVAVDRFAEHDREIAAPQPKRVIMERACSPSSPGLSPVYSSPRHGMTTPPPLNINRADSPAQEQQSPTYSPYSPAEDDPRRGRGKLAHHQHSPGLNSPPRSKDSSPTRSSSLSYSTKAELQRMVTVVLKPVYLRKEISKNQYTTINRDVSRLLYDRVGDAGPNAMTNQEARDKWQKIADDEVKCAVQAISANGAAASSAAEDSASSS